MTQARDADGPLRLWVTRQPPRRFFLLPDGQDPPAGTTGVESTAMQHRSVDLEAMRPWEVSVRQARLWMEGNQAAIDQERADLIESTNRKLETAAEAMLATVNGDDIKHALAEIGIDRDRMLQDWDGIKRLLQDLQDTATSWEPGDEEVRARVVRKVLRRHGHLGANSRIRRDPKVLHQLFELLARDLAPLYPED